MNTSRRKTILVTGATGAVGPRVVEALLQNGHRVRSFSKSFNNDVLPDCVDVRIGDITDRTSVETVVEGVDAIIHMAALLHMTSPSPDMRAEFDRINIGGTRVIIDAATKLNVERVVFFSTIAVYGHSGGHVLNELSTVNPQTDYARTKYDAEQIVLNAVGRDGQPVGTVLRLASIYGSRIKGNYKNLVQSITGNHFIPIGPGINRRTLIYDKDVGRAAAIAVTHPACAGKLYNVTDGSYYQLKHIIESIYVALGRRRPTVTIPLAPARALIILLERIGQLFNYEFQINLEMIDKYVEDIAVDGSLFMNELGFQPHFDLTSGWMDAIREMNS